LENGWRNELLLLFEVFDAAWNATTGRYDDRVLEERVGTGRAEVLVGR